MKVIKKLAPKGQLRGEGKSKIEKRRVETSPPPEYDFRRELIE